jgi:hypothetical protein
LKKGWPLLSTNPDETWLPEPTLQPQKGQPASGEIAA